MIHPVVYKVTARLQNVDAGFLCDKSISAIHRIIRIGQALVSSSLLSSTSVLPQSEALQYIHKVFL
jgi:hypothetical protein